MFGWGSRKGRDAKDEEVRKARGQLAKRVVDLDRERTRLEKLMIQMLEERAKDAH